MTFKYKQHQAVRMINFRKCLYRNRIQDIKQLLHLVSCYIYWNNTERILINQKGFTSVEYRNRAMIS
ncbi:IS3 family transposase [Companilactobacillus versmoldensis]|uniref:IS3 family transposase n=2 Tax=Companilactobacillus versmoldensis TaxID=194326 RepID=UPI0009774A1C